MKNFQAVEMFVEAPRKGEDLSDNSVVGTLGLGSEGEKLSAQVDEAIDALLGCVPQESHDDEVGDGWDEQTKIDGHQRLYVDEGGVIMSMTVYPD